jgi:hypothetical protein
MNCGLLTRFSGQTLHAVQCVQQVHRHIDIQLAVHTWTIDAPAQHAVHKSLLLLHDFEFLCFLHLVTLSCLSNAFPTFLDTLIKYLDMSMSGFAGLQAVCIVRVWSWRSAHFGG